MLKMLVPYMRLQKAILKVNTEALHEIDNRFPVVLIKGLAHAWLLYDPPEIRKQADIDLLCSKRYATRIRRTLQANGYHYAEPQALPSQPTYIYGTFSRQVRLSVPGISPGQIKNMNSLMLQYHGDKIWLWQYIDLHKALLFTRNDQPLTYHRRSALPLDGFRSIYTLPAHLLLVYICAKFYVDARLLQREGRKYRTLLKLLLDAQRLLQRISGREFRKAVELAFRWGASAEMMEVLRILVPVTPEFEIISRGQQIPEKSEELDRIIQTCMAFT